MLRIAKLGMGGESYYVQAVGMEPAGEWLGKGAFDSGLTGEVSRGEDLGALLAGRDPRSGEVLGSFHHRVRVAGFDLTFAAPKSVSVLHGLSEDSVSAEVLDAHKQAVSAAVNYVESRALAVRRRIATGRAVEPIDGAFGAAFVHRTSRAQDPHLHSHVVVANLASGPDGQYRALDGRGIYAHARAIAGLYHAQLRYELTQRLGVEWGPLDRGRADIAGITREVRREFSTRSAQISADLVDTGQIRGIGRRSVDMAALITRAPKDLSVSADDLRPEWRQRAIEHGLSSRRLDSVLNRQDHGLASDALHRHGDIESFRTNSESVVVRLASAGRPVTRRSVVHAWCSELGNGAKARDVEEATDLLLGELTRDGRVLEGQDRSLNGPGVTEGRIPLELLELGPIGRRMAAVVMDRPNSLERSSGEQGRTIQRDLDLGIGL